MRSYTSSTLLNYPILIADSLRNPGDGWILINIDGRIEIRIASERTSENERFRRVEENDSTAASQTRGRDEEMDGKEAECSDKG